MARLASHEVAAAQDPDGPQGPSATWLILQRLDDLRRGLDDVRRGQEDLRADMRALEARMDAKIESTRNWSLGLLLLAILGLLAKLLIPGA